MPSLRWKPDRSTTDPDATVVVFASAFVAPSWRDLAAVARRVPSIVGQLRRTDGMLGYRLDAQVAARRLTTVSMWTDHAAMHSFVAADPHRSAMTSLAGRIGTPTFEMVERRASDVRLDAETVLAGDGARTEGASS